VHRPIPWLLFLLPSSLPACGILTGLDQITESACAPDCNENEGGDDGTSPGEAGGEAEASRGAWLDATEEQPVGSDPASPEAGVVESGSDSAVDSSTGDVSEGGAASDSPAEAAPGDAAPEPPCGTVYFHDAFDSNAHGWTLDPSWSIASTCASPPAPQKGNPDPSVDHTSGASGGVVGAYACGNNPAGQTSAYAYATSPAIDVSAAPSLVLTFYRWLNTDKTAWMVSTVDVFDGSTWANVYTNPPGSLVTDAAWTKVSYDVSAHTSASFRIRFGYSIVASGAYAMSCWNVDDVTLSSATCP
jgi:hypothetical protein